MEMYSIKEENRLEVLQECFGLCESHFYEVCSGHDLGDFNVDWDSLNILLSGGLISVVVARKEGKIAGYFMNIISKDLLTSRLVAKELAIYVDPAYKGSRLFLKMCHFVEALLKARGVTSQYMTFMVGHAEKLPLKLGYKPLEIAYEKNLGG